MKWIGKRKIVHEIFGESEEIIVIEKVNENHPVLNVSFDVTEHYQRVADGEMISSDCHSWGMRSMSSSTLSGIKRLINQDTGLKNSDWDWTVIN